jgi:predicted GIY-YIG superfamily endonuclease
MPFWTYLLENPSGRFYIGHSADLAARLASHNQSDNPRGKFARKNGPWNLVWSEPHPTRSAAMRREREIKSWKSATRIRRDLLAR